MTAKAIPKIQPTRKSGASVLAFGDSKTKIIAIIGIGEMAIPIASGTKSAQNESIEYSRYFAAASRKSGCFNDNIVSMQEMENDRLYSHQ